MSRNLLLSGGPTHDFDVTSAIVASLLADVGLETVVVTHATDAFELLADPGEAWDLVTVNALRWRMEAARYAPLRDEWAFDLDESRAELLADHVADGGGLLALHTAVICFDGLAPWRRLAGASWDWERSSHPPLGQVEITVTPAGRKHPITAGIDRFEVVDEVYGFLAEEPGIEPLLEAAHGGRSHPLLWARQVDGGRVVTDLLGHGRPSVEHPAHAEIIRRSARWALGEDGPPQPAQATTRATHHDRGSPG